MARKLKEFAVYKGDTFRFIDTAKGCAERLGVSEDTIGFYTMPTYQRRLDKRADLEHSTIVVDVSDYKEENQ